MNELMNELILDMGNSYDNRIFNLNEMFKKLETKGVGYIDFVSFLLNQRITHEVLEHVIY